MLLPFPSPLQSTTGWKECLRSYPSHVVPSPAINFKNEEPRCSRWNVPGWNDSKARRVDCRLLHTLLHSLLRNSAMAPNHSQGPSSKVGKCLAWRLSSTLGKEAFSPRYTLTFCCQRRGRLSLVSPGLETRSQEEVETVEIYSVDG